MDELAKYNKERWEELAQAGIEYSRPMLELDDQSARELVDPESILTDIDGKDVLCLAGGGGQQSAAFALLGANVTILDLSETQLQRDQEAAAHYGFEVNAIQGDMRDLSQFGQDAFDIIWHAHSLNFVPEAIKVFGEVAKVLRPNGFYRMSCSNPFVIGVDDEVWDGKGYSLRLRYENAEVNWNDNPYWNFEGSDGKRKKVIGPREFRHTLSTLVNGMIQQGFVLLGIWEDAGDNPDAEPGTWNHFKSIAPPWLTFWATLRPDAYSR